MLTVLILGCVALDVLRELLFKKSTISEGLDANMPLSMAIANPAVSWAGAGAIVWGIEILMWAAVLSYLPLNIAFPVMSLTYAATPLAGKLVFGEVISQRRWLGIALVTSGVMIVGTTGQG